ncbi:MAG: glycosyltransferase family 39 protein [Planctomycetes bacterium]|nr:glycosyltransferase family 39 protein [Planctomycetota bacterium]
MLSPTMTTSSKPLAQAAAQPAVARGHEPERRELPGFGDPGLWLLLAFAAVLFAVAWQRSLGPQLADSIEYMERANALARGEELIDSRAIRAFGFSGILLPIFALARALDVRDFTHVMHACQLLQFGFALALVALSARLAARIVGRSAGLAAGALVAASPILLRWSVEPISGIAAGLFVTLGVATIFDRRTFRSGLVAGAWFGLGILMAYQNFAVVGAIGAFVAVRDFRAARAHTFGVLVGVLALILVQCVLDLFYYGTFAVSVTSYLYQNFGVLVATAIVKVATAIDSRKLYDFSSWLYNQAVELDKLDPSIQFNAADYQERVKQADAIVRRSHGLSWYFENIAKGVPWAALGLVALGVVRACFLRSWKVWLAVVVVLANVTAYGLKGSKDFRLWLPFLSLIGLLGGLGWSTVVGTLRDSAALRLGRGTLARGLLAAACVYGVRENWSTNTRKYGGYWEAIAYVNARTAEAYPAKPIPEGASEAPRDRVSCAWHWAVFLRAAPTVELIKLPHHLDYWRQYDETQRTNDLTAIASLDWFIAHLPVLTDFPEVMEVVNREFAVEAVFFDRFRYEELGPIYVLKKRTGAPGERRFYETIAGRSVADVAAERGFDGSRSMRWCEDTAEGRVTRVTLLDWRYETLPGDGFGWITYTWHGGGFGARDYWFVDHLTTDRLDTSWDNDHYPAYGMYPTSKWPDEWILAESYLVVPERDPFRPTGGPRWFGGEHRRGDLIPATLWMDVAGLNAAHEPVERLEACDEYGDYLVLRALRGRPTLPRGEAIAQPGWTRVGRLWVPVHPAARHPDDGSPVPSPESPELAGSDDVAGD